MYLAIIILLFLGSTVCGFCSKVGVSGAQFITCFFVMIKTYKATIGFFLVVGLYNIGKIVTIIDLCFLIGKCFFIGFHAWPFYVVSAYSNGLYGLVIILMHILAWTWGFVF